MAKYFSEKWRSLLSLGLVSLNILIKFLSEILGSQNRTRSNENIQKSANFEHQKLQTKTRSHVL